MTRTENQELIEEFEQFYRRYYSDEIGELARRYPREQKSLHIDWEDLYLYEPDIGEDFRAQPDQIQKYAEEALRVYDLPSDVSLGQTHARLSGVDSTGIRDLRSDHVSTMIAVTGKVRKATASARRNSRRPSSVSGVAPSRVSRSPAERTRNPTSSRGANGRAPSSSTSTSPSSRTRRSSRCRSAPRACAVARRPSPST